MRQLLKFCFVFYLSRTISETLVVVHFKFCLNFLFVQERERLKEEKKQEKKLLKERKMVRTLESAKDLFRDRE